MCQKVRLGGGQGRLVLGLMSKRNFKVIFRQQKPLGWGGWGANLSMAVRLGMELGRKWYMGPDATHVFGSGRCDKIKPFYL